MKALINISSWGDFKVGDYFEIESPPARKMNDYVDGDIPFVASGEFNNGVSRFLALNGDEEPHESGTITVSPLGGISFYQPYSFLARGGAGSSINLLSKEDLTETQGLFIATVIRKTAKKYGFNNMLSKSKLKNLNIKLPQTENNEPDWKFMERYITELQIEVNERFIALNKIDNIEVFPIPSHNWTWFKMEDLFEIITQGERVRTMDQIDGELPFVMAGFFNGGIKKYIANDVFIYPTNSITMDVFGNVFYRDYIFGASDDVGVYYNETKQYTDNQMLFIATIFERVLGARAFNNKIRASKTKKIKVPLPTDENGNIEWNKIEEFVSDMRTEVDNKFKILTSIVV